MGPAGLTEECTGVHFLASFPNPMPSLLASTRNSL